MPVKKSKLVQDIAKERIMLLFNLAKEEYPNDPVLSRHYIRMMKEISRHYLVKLPKDIKNGFCKKCNSVLLQGVSASTRLVSSKRYTATRCLNCGFQRHAHY
jgi:ribonuclease P protein subunit RPR2